MTTLITIMDEQVDIDDPCAVVAALKKARIVAAVGEQPVRINAGGDDVYFNTANLSGLDRLIADYEQQCSRAGGKRRRYAGSVLWR